MKALVVFLQLLALAPQIIKGVEVIHGEKDSATKQQIAKDSLLLATGVAGAIDPKDSETIANVSAAADGIIDHTVAIFNQIGMFTHKQATATASA